MQLAQDLNDWLVTVSNWLSFERLWHSHCKKPTILGIISVQRSSAKHHLLHGYSWTPASAARTLTFKNSSSHSIFSSFNWKLDGRRCYCLQLIGWAWSGMLYKWKSKRKQFWWQYRVALMLTNLLLVSPPYYRIHIRHVSYFVMFVDGDCSHTAVIHRKIGWRASRRDWAFLYVGNALRSSFMVQAACKSLCE